MLIFNYFIVAKLTKRIAHRFIVKLLILATVLLNTFFASLDAGLTGCDTFFTRDDTLLLIFITLLATCLASLNTIFTFSNTCFTSLDAFLIFTVLQVISTLNNTGETSFNAVLATLHARFTIITCSMFFATISTFLTGLNTFFTFLNTRLACFNMS